MSSFSGPSSVVVLQQLPEGCSDADIRRVMSSFGQVVEIQMHYARNQAEVRLASPQQATTALQQRVVHLHGIAVALDAAAPLQVAPQPYHSGTSGHHHHHHHQQQQPSLGWYGPPAHHTVHVVVEQCTYPISRDVLAEVFSRIGQPTSIQCGPSNLGGTTIGAVTFADPAAAQQAIQDLNAKQIYPGCCTMRLQLGAVAATGPPSPPAASLLSFQGPALVPAAPMGYHHPGNYVAHDSFASQPPNVSPMHMMAPPPFVSQQYPPPGVAGANQMTGYGGTSRGGRGGRGRGSGLQAPGHHHHHHHHLHQHDFTSQLYQHHQYHQHHHQHHHHHHQHFPSPHHHHAMHGATYGGAQLEAAVLIVSNVPEHVPLQSLWVLLEVYGNVNSLRRQHTHKDNVVAHFQHLHDARGVVAHLQNCPFFGSCLQLKHFAGYQDRGAGKVEWNVGPATDPAVHACQFHGSHHRTKPSAPYNPKQKNRPDCNLFVSNLTDAINDEHIRDLFEQRGYKVEDLYRKSPTSAIVQLESVEKAVEALVETHAVQLGGRYVSVAFSRFPPGPGPVAAAAAAVVEGGTSETHQTSADES